MGPASHGIAQGFTMIPPKRLPLGYGLLFMVTMVPLFGSGLTNHGLWRPDEPRVAEIGREMWLTGNWALPTLNGKPFLEKPPLYFLAVAATFKLYGEASDRVARIPSGVFGFGGAVALFLLGRMVFGPRVGFLSAFILATSMEYFRTAHWLLVDSALVWSVISAMACFMAGYLAEGKGWKTFYYLLFYLFSSLAFLSKGLIGLAFPGLGVLAFLIFERNLKALWTMRVGLGTAVFFGLSVPWVLALWHADGGGHLKTFFVENHLQRFLSGGRLGHHRPLYFYLTAFPESFLPWTSFLIPVLWRAFFWREENPSRTSEKGLRFMKCWLLTGFVFLTLASTKRGVYLLPVVAPMAVLTAWWIDTTLRSAALGKVERIFVWGFGLLILGAGVGIGPYGFYLAGKLSVLPLVHAVVVVGLLVWAFKWMWKRRTARFWVGSCAAVFSILMFELFWIAPSMDRYKSFVPFVRKLEAAVGPREGLYAYLPDETVRGFVPFYTGRYVEEVYDKKVLEKVLDRKDRIFVVAMDKRGSVEREVLSTGKAYLMVRQRIDKKHVCSLLTNKIEGVLE